MTSPELAQAYPEPFATDVVEGLSRRPKKIPFQYFYDDTGARLFTRICVQPEYYVTRTETAILRDNADAIAEAIGPAPGVAELGSGNGQKTRVLLDHLEATRWYVPMDIAAEQLDETAAILSQRYPELPVRPFEVDFTQPFQLPASLPPVERRLLFSPGLTLWNLSLAQRKDLLTRLRQVAGPNGRLLLGVDWAKDAELLEAAYDDGAGVTARFNLNVLVRINRELGGTFRLEDFVHRARWDAQNQRVEVAVVAQRDVRVHAAGAYFEFHAGETIVTEYSYKFTPDTLAQMLREVGWEVERRWSDDQAWMSVVLLKPLDDG